MCLPSSMLLKFQLTKNDANTNLAHLIQWWISDHFLSESFTLWIWFKAIFTQFGLAVFFAILVIVYFSTLC